MENIKAVEEDVAHSSLKLSELSETYYKGTNAANHMRS